MPPPPTMPDHGRLAEVDVEAVEAEPDHPRHHLRRTP